MKKNIYFIITSIIGIVLNIYSIIMANDIAKQSLESIKKMNNSMNGNLFEKITDVYQHHGNLVVILSAIISLIIFVTIFMYAKNDKIADTKGLLIFLSILAMLLTESSYIILIGIINIVVIANTKKEKEKTSKEKMKIPIIEPKKSSLKEKVLAAALLIVYFSQILWSDYIPNNKIVAWTVLIAFDIIVLSLAIFVFFEDIKKGIKLFKDNRNAYTRFLLSSYGIGLLLFMLSNIIAMNLTHQDTSVNQSLLETYPLWYVAPSAIIFAPIVEELLFRGSIRRFINNKVIFIIISAIIFGLLHVLYEETLFNALIMGIPYAVLGGTLAYIYAKTDNICGNIFIHGLHNTIAVILMVLFK